MSKQPVKIDYVPADEQAERSARRKGLTAAQPAEQDAHGEEPDDQAEQGDDLDEDGDVLLEDEDDTE